MRFFSTISLLAACTDAAPLPPIVGPVTRFVVDGIRFPTTYFDAKAFGSDLDGDGIPDDAIGDLTVALATQDDTTTDVPDLITDGVVSSSLDLTMGSDGAVGLTYFGSDGDPGTLTLLRASLAADGSIATDGLQKGSVPIVLPVLADADPTQLVIDEAQLQLVPDGAGFTVRVQGAADAAAFGNAAAAGLVQMIYANPRAHLILGASLDINHDGVVTPGEALVSPIVQTLAAPDLKIGISFGLELHVSPCVAGSCTTAPIADHCHDRIRDADEVGVDCGGGCIACAAGVACTQGADCESGTCSDDGTCAAPSCSDGRLDGFETDVDCGGGQCAACTTGHACLVDGDCASKSCNGGLIALGTCS
jgi:hypothetical protein